MANIAADQNPTEHYLRDGWRDGLEPNATFPGWFLKQYFRSAGMEGPPALTWLTLSAGAWPIASTREDIVAEAASIRQSGLFDETYYAQAARLAGSGLDPATHYVLVGERLGIPPSERFDPKFYLDRNPDIRIARIAPLHHFRYTGIVEGRQGRAAAPMQVPGRAALDPARENVLLFVHYMERTGAPILAWNIGIRLARHYNVFTIRLGGGPLTPFFEDLSVEVLGPIEGIDQHPTSIRYSLAPLFARHKFRYAIANSVASRTVIEPCVRNFVPTLLLMHEFASVVYEAHSLPEAFDWATEIVYSADIVERASKATFPEFQRQPMFVLPQGSTRLPPGAEIVADEQPASLLELARRRRVGNMFVVMGAGTVTLRKGVDLFIAAAAALRRADPAMAFEFVWAGAPDATEYPQFIEEQIERAGLKGYVTLLGELPGLGPLYQLADIFFLSSRLDPLPNVLIDAAIRGIPVVCFENASGCADILAMDKATRTGVVGHLDAQAAAEVIRSWLSDEALRRRIAEATRAMAVTTFDMDRYVARLNDVGSVAVRRVAQLREDARTLSADGTFDQEMFLGLRPVFESRDEFDPYAIWPRWVPARSSGRAGTAARRQGSTPMPTRRTMPNAWTA